MNKYKNRQFLLKFLILITICIIIFAYIINLKDINKKCTNYIKYKSNKNYFNVIVKKIVGIANFFICESKKIVKELTNFDLDN